LDGFALPKWRKESIMGYGNAIVPQIALRIFRTIVKCDKYVVDSNSL
jgi:DNA (cytosine-5)-methyltransferase 1